MKNAKQILIRVFDYIEPLDAFYPTEEFRNLIDRLKISDWSWVEWIGRYFIMDNDFGEHWFDNWNLREAVNEEEAEALGYYPELLLLIDPAHFQNGKDGPCHTDDERKQFWTDVLFSLHLSLETIFIEARKRAAKSYLQIPEAEQEQIIITILKEYNI